ncbi:pro-epidermal growth factor [Megalobrama amblycephala]|uniref:pro-epidermal growth factor n=1 Tax=Megalobrama amblycephala TaxID=75352 RepID=UPI0020147DF7|nr:pro-epidermal growth factor [Megalobrama amblycephala]
MFWRTIAATFHLWFWMVSLGPARASGPAEGALCWGGRPWAAGNFSCVDPEPYLLLGLGNGIQRMNLDGGDQRRIASRVGRSILLDFHLSEGTMFWADTHAGQINRAGLDGTGRQKLLLSVKRITGLAVNWIENSVLWSNADKGTIHRMDTDGRNEKTVLRDLSQPKSVVVDPNERYIFWLSDGVTPSIQRSDVTGGKKATVLKVADRLKVLAIDHRDRRLFWVQQGQGGLTAMGSCNYDGNIINVFNHPFRPQALRMTIFLDYVYLTDFKSKRITRVNKYTGGRGENVNSKRMPHPPADVKVVHPINQPVVEVPTPFNPGCNRHTGECVKVCSSRSDTGPCRCRDGFSLSKQGNYCEDINECALWNHGCSLGCENVPGSYFCTCPKGYVLLPDLKTCQETKPCVENGTVCDHACVHTAEGDVCVCPEDSVLNSDGHSCTGCLSADRGGCSQLCVTLFPGRWVCECQPGYQLQPDGKHCAATGPPSYLLFANVVDIRKINTNGKQSRKLLEEPRGTIIAVDYDPVQKRVYFAEKGLKRIERASLDGGFREMLFSTGLDSPEGLAVDWVHRKLYWTDRGLSSISRSSLNGLDREIFIDKDIQKPRGIALHPQAQKVYWTDMGSRPAVERSGLNREMREVVVSTSLVSPSGVTVDHGSQRLYWCDLSRGVIESAKLDGSNRHILSENQVGHPFDVAVFENVLWVSDWEDHLLHRLDMRTGRNLEHVHDDTMQPASLAVVHPLAKPGADVCLHENGGCAQVCESRLGLAHCSCHSTHVLSADGKDCLSINTSFPESDDGESSDRLRNKTLNDESTPLAMLYTEKMISDQDDCYSLRCDVNAQCVLREGRAVCQCVRGFTGDGELCVDVDECKAGLADCSVSEAECMNTAGGYFCQCKTGFSGDGQHCMDIDECRLNMHDCDVNAECLNAVGKYQCRCRSGFTGTGFSCQEKSKGAPSWLSTGSPLDVTSPWQHNNVVQSCPSTHDSYCLSDGVCFYFPEMESYACNCALGYMGERCQFSDLEWWELQQAEEEKRRNMAIAMCIVLFITLLSIAACITYCYGSKRHFATCPSEDDVGDISMSEDSFTETTTTTPQVYVVLDTSPCGDEKVLHVVGCPRATICPSCSSDAGGIFASEETVKLQRDNSSLDVAICSVSCDVHTFLVTEKATDNLISLEDPQAAPQ